MSSSTTTTTTTTTSPSAASGRTVVFEIGRQLYYGDRVAVCGSAQTLGRWNVEQAIELAWVPGDVWRSRRIEVCGEDQRSQRDDRDEMR